MKPDVEITEKIYDPEYVGQLFEQMSATYDRVNRITSFGFSARWRRQCVAAIDLQPGMHVVDFMTGMGEAWPYILAGIGRTGRLTAVDFCSAMIRMAEKQRARYAGHQFELLEEDALRCSIPSEAADAVIATFGLKTFSRLQTECFAAVIWQILKPGGQFSLIEISAPPNHLLAVPYLFYLKKIIPYLGKVLLGDPDSYRMLGVYTQNFKSCSFVKPCFEHLGFQVELRNYFGGSASGLVGRKPG